MHTLAQLRAGQLAGLTRLDLSENLTEFPPEIFALADTLEILNLSGNQLTALPDELPRLRRLRVLFCSDNRFEELPAVLGRCPALRMIGFKANRIRRVPGAALPPRLRWLILTDNEIAELPPEIGHCAELQKLMLAGNRLAALPASMASLQQLELLRLAANRLPALPDWLPQLPRLAWLAAAGNPGTEAAEAAAVARHPLPTVAWAELQPEGLLGEGASGRIYAARWQPAAGAPRAVALKLFKGHVTSDGLPQSEMDACIAAGRHPRLVGVLGRVDGHPAGAAGLVLPLIDPSYTVLAGPPSLSTCTRDVYAPDWQLSWAALHALVCGMAGALSHLHAQGVLHGDFYAHNILWKPTGEALLSDFGAASFCEPGTELGQQLQRLEVRAFGLLLGELLARCPELATHAVPAKALQLLQQRCVQEAPAARPLMAAVAEQLALLPDGGELLNNATE